MNWRKTSRAVRKRAATLVLEDGEVFVQQKNRKVKVIRSREDQLLSVQACHSDPTSGHFGMKTWRRLTDLFFMSDTTVHYFKFIVNRFFCMYWPGIYYSLFKADTVTWGSKFCQGGPNFVRGVHIFCTKKFRGEQIFRKVSSRENWFGGSKFAVTVHLQPKPS